MLYIQCIFLFLFIYSHLYFYIIIIRVQSHQLIRSPSERSPSGTPANAQRFQETFGSKLPRGREASAWQRPGCVVEISDLLWLIKWFTFRSVPISGLLSGLPIKNRDFLLPGEFTREFKWRLFLQFGMLLLIWL